MDLNNRFRVNSLKVTHETLDGEVVIINLDTGSYYSTNSAGATIWNLIDAGASIGQIVEAIANNYVGDPREIATGVSALVENAPRRKFDRC